jgi:hypothetical protein
LPNDLNIRSRSKRTNPPVAIAFPTYFSIELNTKYFFHPISSYLLFYFARTKQTASFNTLSPNIIA